jgi:hypothetical protein
VDGEKSKWEGRLDIRIEKSLYDYLKICDAEYISMIHDNTSKKIIVIPVERRDHQRLLE